MMSQIDFHLFVSHNTLQYGDISSQGSLAVLGSFADWYSIARNQYGNRITRITQSHTCIIQWKIDGFAHGALLLPDIFSFSVNLMPAVAKSHVLLGENLFKYIIICYIKATFMTCNCSYTNDNSLVSMHK